MLAAIPKSSFFNQINQIILNETLEPSTLSQFKDDAQKRLQSDDTEGYLALATLAYLEGNVEAVHENHQRALAAITTRQAYALSLYAKCLIPFGAFSPAANLMLNAYDLSKEYRDFEAAIDFYGLAGCFHQVGKLLQQWESINPNQVPRFAKIAPALIQFMDKQQVSDKDLEGLIHLTMSILRQHHKKLIPETIEIALFSNEEYQWFHYGIPLHESLDIIMEMNSELADRSVEECPPQIIQGGFVPLFKALGDE